MKNPDLESDSSDNDSDELVKDFDFIAEGRKRAGAFFRGKPKKDDKEKSLAELMKKNDFHIINKMLEKVINHELAL